MQAAEDAWNSRDPDRVAAAYTADCVWRNRDEFITGTDEIVAFLTRKWQREHDYALRKALWGFRLSRMAVRFQYEWHDDAGQTWRSYGNELWEFTDAGLMRRREASIKTSRSIRRSDASMAPGLRPSVVSTYRCASPACRLVQLTSREVATRAAEATVPRPRAGVPPLVDCPPAAGCPTGAQAGRAVTRRSRR